MLRMQLFQSIFLVLLLTVVSNNPVDKLSSRLKVSPHETLPLSKAIELVNSLNQPHHDEDLQSEHQMDI
jgi:hypothetical protein